MSTVSVAPRIVLDGPVPVPPLRGLVATATELADTPHWEAGAAIYSYPCGMPSGHDPCSLGTFRVKADPDEVTHPEPFPAFTAYLGEICSSVGIGNWDEWKERANVALLASESWALERQLVAADYMDAPHLGDANVDVIAGPHAAMTAVAHLENAIAATGRQGVMHLTPAVATILNLNIGDDDVLRTASGTPIIVGQGYVGADAPTGGSAAAAGQDWIYASGGVVFRRGSQVEALPETLSEAIDRTDNTVIYRAERDLWVAFDGCVQAAVLADWSP